MRSLPQASPLVAAGEGTRLTVGDEASRGTQASVDQLPHVIRFGHSVEDMAAANYAAFEEAKRT
jgi:hypothetical protein